MVRALATAGRFECVLGMNAGAVQRLAPPLAMEEFPRVQAESFSPAAVWRAGWVARQARQWLRADVRRVFHGHSRAGLLAALWLRGFGERRVVASVHTFGRQKSLYRLARRLLGWRLFWLSPGMKSYYGLQPASWDECLPGCVPALVPVPRQAGADGLIRFGAVGPFAAYKRWDVMIQALARLAPEVRKRVRVIHAGADDLRGEGTEFGRSLLTLARESGVENLIEWRGRIVPLTSLWEQIDCLLVASPIEAFSVAAIEAVGAGRPVIASDTSGTSDFIRACAGGWLFRGGLPESLADVMSRVITENRLAGWQADRAALAEFTAPVTAGRYRRVYDRLGAG